MSMPSVGRTLSANDFIVKDSSIPGIGLGLFANLTIYKGETIGQYTGQIISDIEASQEPFLSSHYILWVCKNHWIVGEGINASYTKFINHKDDPNARFVVSRRWKKARVEALKRICRDEEIFVDYGPYFFQPSEVK